MGLTVAWASLVGAGERPMPAQLPLPDLLGLVPIVAAPLDKPVVTIPHIPSPPVPNALLPSPPPATAIVDWKMKETITPPQAGTAVCFVRLTARQHLECGRARYQRGELEDAAWELDQAARSAGQNPDVLHEARYWQAEALYRLQRFVDAQRLFLQVYRDVPREDIGLYSVYSTGHIHLQQRDYEHARESFEVTRNLVKAGPLFFSSQHWRALSLYYQGKYADARQGWEALEKTNPPPALAREIPFWLAESLRELGQPTEAAQQLRRFMSDAPSSHPLLPAAALRTGWLSLRAGDMAGALNAFRRAESMAGQSKEQEWVQLGLDRASSGPEFARRFAVAEKLREAHRSNEAHALHHQLLGRRLTSNERAWVLFNEGEVFRRDGALDDARTQYDLARKVDPTTQLGWQAGLRVAQINFELREFTQALTEAAALLSQPAPLELRATALLMAGEAAYYARDHDAAANWFRKFLAESRTSPRVKDAMLSLAWAELRRGKEAEARRLFSDFARDFASDPAAPDALMLSSELATAMGDFAAAQQGYERIPVVYPGHPRTALALLDAAILMLPTNRLPNAISTLREFLKAAPDSPQAPRARTALGAALLASGAPGEAEREFAAALAGGEGAIAQLGAGLAAIELKRWSDSERHLTAARETGSPVVADRAEHALAVLVFRQHKKDEFKRQVMALVNAGRPTAPLLYALAEAETHDRAWDAALQTTTRLVSTFPEHPTADNALARLGLAAVSEKRWAIGSEALKLLRSKYPRSEFLGVTLLPAMETLIETGSPAEAVAPLQQFIAAFPHDPRAKEASLLLARARAASSDPKDTPAARLSALRRKTSDQVSGGGNTGPQPGRAATDKGVTATAGSETQGGRTRLEPSGSPSLGVPAGEQIALAPPVVWPTPDRRLPAGIHFGRYFALIIANQAYDRLPLLKTPIADATQLAAVLKETYEFSGIRVLTNAKRSDIIRGFDDLRRTVSETDNVLIYYAGHGWLDEQADRGYWLPIDAERDSRANWLSTADVTDTLRALKAKHVLVVADSCYSGTLTRDVAVSPIPDADLVELARRRSRTVLTSGGLEPVSDVGGGKHSVFARAFLGALRQISGAADLSTLFPLIRRQVMLAAPQTPQYSDVRYAGHEGGDFVFVRRR